MFFNIKKYKLNFRLSGKSGAGFTLIEVAVVIIILAILSGIILFSVNMYINKSKDSNAAANLAILVPAGEVYYNIGNTYDEFCNSSVATNAKNQLPVRPNGETICGNNKGFCCDDNIQSWAACVKKFTDSTPLKAFCVDSRGIKKDIDNSACVSSIITCN